MTLKKKSFENIVGKRENAANHMFSFLDNAFYLSHNSFSVTLILSPEMLSIWTSLKIFRLVKELICCQHKLSQCDDLNSLPEDKFLPISKDLQKKTKCYKNYYFCLRAENTVGKGEKCWLSEFSPFPRCFQKASF